MKTTLTFLLLIFLSLQLSAQTSADSVTVPFRCYYSSGTTVSVPGEFNGWNTAASPMTYNATLQCWTRAYSFKIHASGRTLADSVFQYKFYQGGTWTSDPLNQEVNTADNNNSILRMSKLFWFDYNQFLSGTNITRMTVSLVHANSDNISSVMLTYGTNPNATLTTVNVTSGFDASKRIWDWTLGTSIPKSNYIRLVAVNNHGDSTVYTRGGYIWYYRTMPSYVLNGVTLPSVSSNDSTSFRLRVSNKDYVLLRIAPVGQPVATATAIPLNHDNGNDNWWINLKLANGTYEYIYEIENGKQIMDPWGRYVGTNGTRFTVGPEGLTADNYSWRSNSYQRPPLNKLVIYELNPMEFAGGYYNISANQVNWIQMRTLIPYLDSLGINAIELMPVTDFSSVGYSGFSWGYDINSYFALEPTLGTPAAFKQFVDSAHSRGIAVIMDMVFNHLNETSTLWQMQPDEALNPYFKSCTDYKYNEDNLCFFKDLDHWNSQTQELVYSSLKMWIDQYRIDGFRYDYTQGIGWNQSDTTNGILGWANKIASDYNNTVYQIAEHLPESPALVYYSGMTGGWHGSFREKLFNEASSQNTSLIDFENHILGLSASGTNDSPSSPANYANRTEPVNDASNHDEQSLFYEMIHYQHIDTATALKRDRLYATFMFTSLGIPMLWEGIEFGAPRGYDGNKLDYRPVEWNYYKTANGKAQFQYYHTLIMQRRYNPALYQGNLVTQYRYDADRVLVWGFNDPVTGAQVEVVANLSGSAKTETNIPWLSAGTWYDVFDQSPLIVSGTPLASMTIPAYTAKVYTNRRNSDLGIPSGTTTFSGLIASYPFTGNASDSSGNAINGVVNGSTLTSDRFGNANKAYSFNGSSDFIQVPHSSLFTFSSKATINLWVKADSGGTGNPRFFSKGSTPNGMEYFSDSVGNQQKRVAFTGDIAGTSGLFGGYSKSLIGNQTWTMLTYIHDSLTSKLYINGVLDTTFANANGVLPQTTDDLFFGKHSQASTDYFNGSLDDINIYNKTLTQTQVDSLYHIGKWGWGSIAGTKYHDINGDSSTAGDAGVSGWVIKLYNNCSLVARKVTDSNGNYKFDSLNVGTYTVEESLKTGWGQTYPQVASPNVITSSCGVNAGTRSYSITMTLNATITGVNFANTQYGRICGVKFRDDNGNGRKDSGEPGLSNWTIELSGSATNSSVTDNSGNYCFTGIPPGTYSLSEVQQPNWIQTSPNYTSITLTSGLQLDTFNIGNFQYGNIGGFVFSDASGDGTKQLSDSTLAGWTVYLEKVGQSSPFDSSITDVDGLFIFDSLTYGQYIITQEKRSGWTQSTPEIDTILVVSGTTLDTLGIGNVYGTFVEVAMLDRWNMVSLPLTVSNASKSIIYPTAVSSAFKYVGSYTTDDTIDNRVGYWLKFPTAQTVRIAGSAITADTIPVSTNWNMIGSISLPVPVSNITSIPPGIATSSFYTFDHGYNVSDTILPGKAYWVKASQSGVLIVSSSTLLNAQNRITVQRSSELPPSPPTGDNVTTDIPTEFSLGQNYPNPFNPETIIPYALPATNFVSLSVYNLLGQHVATLVNEMQEAGWHEISFNASTLPSGIYMYRIQAGEYNALKKFVLMK